MRAMRAMIEAQAQQAREQYEAEQAQYVWSAVSVKYCIDQGEWIVYGHARDKRPEVITTARLKAEAISEAQLYAFDTSAGPQRAERVYTYGKRGQLLDCYRLDNRGRVIKS